jgi:tRNA-2-methylthio-N6-dimethylallyladenosine synthase
MNFSDSEIIASVLSDAGYEFTDDIQLADIIFLNTCSIREHAETKALNRLKSLQSLRKKNNAMVIGVLGCMAEQHKEKLFENNLVDVIAGPDSYRSLPQLIKTVEHGEKAFNILLSSEETYGDINPVKYDSNGVSAFISIMRGCQNFCSYCVVPHTRGKERSRDAATIVNEAAHLFEKGFKEITLLGQNVNSYSFENIGFPELLKMVAAVNPQLRIRFATSHPKDISDELIRTIAETQNICNHIHLPMQSGSNAVLKKMNRKYTAEYYLERIETIKKLIPDCGLSTDIIAGFCSETEEDHRMTLKAMTVAAFDAAFMFKYSQRSGTTAADKFADDVSETDKTRRLSEIISLQQELSLQNNKKDIGKSFEVLIEGTSKRSKKQLFGRTQQNKVVVFNGAGQQAGDYAFVKITDCTSATLKGELIN